MSTNDELKKIMNDKGLDIDRVTALLGTTQRTVLRWLQPKESKTYVECPRHRLEMLKMKMGVV